MWTLAFVADSATAAGFRSRKKREMNNKMRLPETTAAQLQADVAYENAKIESSRGSTERQNGGFFTAFCASRRLTFSCLSCNSSF